jgi:hypothetical protein
MNTKRCPEFYKERILEMMSECVHSGEFDHEEFENKVSGLKAAAVVDGLSQESFSGLVSTALKEGWITPQKKAS